MAAVNQPEGAPSPRRDAGRKEARPTAARIVLGARLRALRQASGVSREDAAGRIRGSHAKITRLERGQVGFKERDLEDLLTLYGVLDPAEREECYALARQANTPGWWQPYNDVLESWFEPHLGLEEAAALIRTYEVQFLPGEPPGIGEAGLVQRGVVGEQVSHVRVVH
ncbi:helix-turn-helix transcriptional regulator, partial [Streptomyces sp. NPDC048845]|uniref:helix-turn-helix domain-containing protein n=1 Tax=Streptomyces sp. NPDC048845 TaxID=3155390 RepID=UPI00344356C9